MGGGKQYNCKHWVFHKRDLSSMFWTVAPCNSLDKQILTLLYFSMIKINIKYFPVKGGFETCDLKDFLIKYLMPVLLSFWNSYTFGPWQPVSCVPASSPHTFCTICHQYETEGNKPCFQWKQETGGVHAGVFLVFRGFICHWILCPSLSFFAFLCCLLFLVLRCTVSNTKSWVNFWQATIPQSYLPVLPFTPQKKRQKNPPVLVLHWFGNIFSPVTVVYKLWHI